MDEKFANLKKNVLIDLVKLAQKQGMEGSKGGWKQFLIFYDKKFGDGLSDPARRSNDILIAFLNTFSKEGDIKFFDKVLQRYSVHEQSKKKSPDSESPEQSLVLLTLGHSQYPTEYCLPSHEEDWLVTKGSKGSKMMRPPEMVAVDCEMVLCEDGTEALVRVCVVDRNLEVKLNQLVNPYKPVADYRTDITGISAKDLDGVTCSLADVQKSMRKILSHGTILVGHSLNNDLKALKIDHARVIDTSYVFKYMDKSHLRRPSLMNLCKFVLGYELRENGAPHNCLDDACTAMKLVLARLEHGVDLDVPLVHENVPDSELAKLLIHRIPKNVPSNMLHDIIPGDFSIELKNNKKGQGNKYSAFAIFKNQEEANRAFVDVEGNEEKDSSGRPQKFITFALGAGKADLCIRKMATDDFVGRASSKKRSFQDQETSDKSKKLKIDQKLREDEESKVVSNQCDVHLKEIERLKQELSQKDQENSNLHKIIAALTRKQGL